MTTASGHSARAERALARLAEVDPAFATLALWVRHRDADIEGFAESSEGTIRYGPAFEVLSLPEQVGIAAHHVLHIALRHAARGKALGVRLGKGFDAKAYNLAADAIVNDVLRAAGFVLPRPFVTISGVMERVFEASEGTRAALAKLDAERLYLKLAAAQGAQGQGGRDGEDGDGEGEGTTDALERYAAAEGFSEDLSYAGTDTGETGAGDADEWPQRLARALDVGQAAGRGIGVLARQFAELAPAATPWEQHLRNLVARVLTDGSRPSPAIPSRRWLAGVTQAERAGSPVPGFEFAVARRMSVPRIAVAVDVSGSIDDARLTLFAGQIAAIAQRAGAELHLVSFDDDVGSTLRLSGADWGGQLKRMAMKGGGGTSFVEPVAAAQDLSASLLVVLTDLHGRFGPQPRALPVIWAVPDIKSAPRPPFGTVIDLAA